MPTAIRIATLNLQNFDDQPGQSPTLAERIAVLRPQLARLRADILCLQEVNGQEQPGQPRQLLALQQLIAGTDYAGFNVASTRTADGTQVYDERNLVVLSRFPITEHRQIKHEFAPGPARRKVTSASPEPDADSVTWERPILYVRIAVPDNGEVHVLNAHLKSSIPSDIPGRKTNDYTRQSVFGRAEGFLLSAMERLDRALEMRTFIDQLFDQDPDARVVACGDFNADLDAATVHTVRGDVENRGNSDLARRAIVPCERSIPEPSRFSLYHQGQGNMLDHLLVSRPLLAFYRGTEIHNTN